MVIQIRPSWLLTVREVGRPLFFFMTVAILVSLLHRDIRLFDMLPIPDLTVTVLGAGLGLLLGFRTNSAYARWWEARTLWGALLNNSRSLARQVISFTEQARAEGCQLEVDAFVRTTLYMQIAYAHALRCWLRNQKPWDEIRPFLGANIAAALAEERNVPAALLQRMGSLIADAQSGNLLTELRLHRLDATLTAICDIQGGCERIKNTPLPRQYDYYPERFIEFYCLLLPVMLVREMGWLTPFATFVVSFAFLVVNRIGKNLEEPFENRVYDTPMTSLCRTIEINIRQALGEKELPPPIAPVDGVLW
jgi:putative membrane protein